jgi:radical SAM protein with 4Fe4S-binding SPASM domain
MFKISEFIKNKLQDSSQHFQVALQVIDLNPRKMKRIIETGFSMYRGTERAKNPLFLHIEPTGACNLKCTMCPRTESITRELRHMKFEVFKKICDNIDPIFIAFVGFGEPLVNPRTLDMVTYSVKKGITSRISSNATMLNSTLSHRIIKTGLHQVWFSVDSPTAENFEQIRVGAQFDKTIAGIKEFDEIRQKEKSKLVITVNFTIIKENAHEISKMVKFCHEHLHILPTFARGYGYDIEAQQNRALKNTPEIQSYLQEGVHLAAEYNMHQVARNLQTISNDLKNPLDGRGPCYFPYYVVAVSWDGKASPCCLFYDYQMNLGNVAEKPFQEVWNGRAYQRFRMKLKTHRCDIKICNTCPLNDISLHNIMHKITKIPGAGLLTKEKYNYIDRTSYAKQSDTPNGEEVVKAFS